MAIFLDDQGQYGATPYGTGAYGGVPSAPFKVQKRIGFLIHNAIEEEASFLTSDSTAFGFLSSIRSVAAGGGGLFVQGDYNGNETITVVIKIVDVSAGNEIGKARYHYSLDGGRTFFTNNFQGFVTHSDPIQLQDSNGIEIGFTPSVISGIPSFILGDEYTLIAFRDFNVSHLVEWNRRVKWRANDLIANIDIAFLSADIRIHAFALNDNNMVPGDTIKLMATNNTLGGGVPDFTNPDIAVFVDFEEGNAAHVFTEEQVFKFWRVQLSKQNGSPEAGHLFLGKVMQLSREINKQFSFESRRFTSLAEFRTGNTSTTVHGRKKFFQGNFTRLSEEDRSKIIDLWNTSNQISERTRPFYLVNFPTTPVDYLFAEFTQDKLAITHEDRERLAWTLNVVEA